MLGRCFLESININLDAQKKIGWKIVFFLGEKFIGKVFRETFSDFFGNKNHSKPTREYPYTHRIDRGNKRLQIMQKIFTELENAFAGNGWP